MYDLTYASPKGGRVTAYLVAPAGKGPFAGLVFGHWGPGNRTEFLPEATLYARAGAASLLVDYPWVRSLVKMSSSQEVGKGTSKNLRLALGVMNEILSKLEQQEATPGLGRPDGSLTET